MLQVYGGDGKGKTTAAVGAVIRAVGSGMRVLFVQFLKNGDSSECAVLRSLPSVTCRWADEPYVLLEPLSPARQTVLTDSYRRLLREVVSCAAAFDMVVLDEVLDALRLDLLNEGELLAFLKAEKDRREFLLTGREPPETVRELADYMSDIRMVKHPFTGGVGARCGIEY